MSFYKRQISHEHYTYDANGNPTRVENDSTAAVREMYWDEDNRLMVLSDNGKTSRYTYNHVGERAVKSHGSMEGVYINGAPQGITFHETDEYTLYPASIISVNKNRFTKHYFIGDKRIASRIGSGSFNNVYGQNGSFLTAGQQDYAERLNQIETQREDYYRELGIAPGIPTMKGSYGDPENTGVGYNTIIKELGDHTVPAEWAQYVKHNTEADTAPGAPIQWDDPSDPESAQPGYGFVADNSTEEETFYYHSDHLGSTSYITDKDGNITQYDAYLPYGELLVDEHSSSEDLPYKFNGKELDEETGLYYYGARYMQPMASIWYGVDPLAEEYPNLSAYCYTLSNPIRFIDPDGNVVGVDNVIGGIVGGLTEIGTQMIANVITDNDVTDIHWGQVGIAAGEGFVTSGASTVVRVGAKVVAATASSAIENHEKGTEAVLTGTAKNLAGGAASKNVSKVFKGVANKQLQKVSNKMIKSRSSLTKTVQKHSNLNKKNARSLAAKIQNTQKRVAKGVRSTPQKTTEMFSNAAIQSAPKNRKNARNKK